MPVETDQKDDETRKERLDRELIELLNELRVVLPGVQVLFAFLLTVPFSQGFTKVTDSQKLMYITSVVLTALASIFLIAPTSYHRIRFRQGDKEQMLRTSNRLALVATIFLAAAITVVVYLTTDFVYGGGWAATLTALIGGLLVGFWYALPIVRRLRDGNDDGNDKEAEPT